MILDLLRNDHHDLKYVASTNGGEWAGPCPWCDGEDRFRVWPEQGRYWCRQCNRSGDAACYLQQFRKMTAGEIRNRYNITIPKSPGRGRKWNPKQAKKPGFSWQSEAEAFLVEAQRNLWSKNCIGVRQWLMKRSLSANTIKSAELGYHFTNRNQPKKKWGVRSNSGSTNIWLPPGLVIPYRFHGGIIRLRIRRNGGRYIMVSGSSSMPMVWKNVHNRYVVVESELDGILLNQEAGDRIGIIALGSVSIRPDLDTHERLIKSKFILVSLDFDQAGAKRSRQWWLKVYPQARRWPVPVGKDPGEAYKEGLDLRKWIEAGFLN